MMQLYTTRRKVIKTPTLLYNYQIIEEFSNDCYSSTVKVQDINTEIFYRAKIYSKKYLQYLRKVKMIHNEIQILRMLDHPNISKLHEYFNIKNEDGEKLTVLIENFYPKGNLTEYKIENEIIKRKIEYGILQAVNYLHQKGIVHLNINPENIYIDDDLNPILSGFGASKQMKHKYDFYDYSYLENTYYYPTVNEMNCLPPEFFVHSYRTFEKKYDIWSIGMVLFYITEHRFPFKRFNRPMMHTIIQFMKSDHKDVMTIIRKCTNINPSLRPDIQILLNEHYFHLFT